VEQQTPYWPARTYLYIFWIISSLAAVNHGVYLGRPSAQRIIKWCSSYKTLTKSPGVRVIGFVDFMHLPELYLNRKHKHFGNWICFYLLVREGRHLLCSVHYKELTSITGPNRIGPLENLTSVSGPTRIGVSFPSPGDGNRSSFGHVVSSSHLEFRTMDKVQKPTDSERCTPSSEHFCFLIWRALNVLISEASQSNIRKTDGEVKAKNIAVTKEFPILLRNYNVILFQLRLSS
jgi:hypothetical protein